MEAVNDEDWYPDTGESGVAYDVEESTRRAERVAAHSQRLQRIH